MAGCGGTGPQYLCGVVVEDDGVEVSTVVVLDQVLCGVRHLQTPGAETLLLQERLIQSKDHLKHKPELYCSSCTPAREPSLSSTKQDVLNSVP